MSLGCFHTWFDCLVRTRVPLLSLPPAPAGQRLYYFIWVRTVIRLRHQPSSCFQSFSNNDTYVSLTEYNVTVKALKAKTRYSSLLAARQSRLPGK